MVAFGQTKLLSIVSPKYSQCCLLIRSLQAILHPMDAPLRSFITDTIQHFHENENDPVELQKIKENLLLVMNAMSTGEFDAVKAKITEFRAEFGIYKDAKAAKIEQALYNTPLNERDTVVSNPIANEVQSALAEHRNPFKESPELPGGQIDYEKAADSFKTLKEKFKQGHDQSDEPDDNTKLGL